MTKRNLWPCLLIAGVIALSTSACGGGDDEQTVVEKSGRFANDLFITADHLTVVADLSRDLFAAAGELRIDSSILGDVFVAGGDVSVGQNIGGSLIATGGEISITGAIGDGMIVLGGDIRLIRSTITGNTIITGGSINIAGDTHIDGKLIAAGGRLFLNGTFAQDIRAACGEITIGGEVDGDVKIVARRIILLPGTRITGSLIYHAPEELDIADGVTIGKDVNYIQTSMGDGKDVLFFAAGFTHLALLIGLIILTASVIYMAPTLLPAFSKRFHVQILKAFLGGFALIVLGPVVGVILVTSIVGIPLAIGLLAVCFLLMIAGYIAAVFIFGSKVLSLVRKPVSGSKLSQLGAAAVGIVLMALIVLVPVVGLLAFLAALSMGVGSVLLQLFFFRRGYLIQKI